MKAADRLVAEVLATGKVEAEDPKHAVLSYRAEKYHSVWRSLIGRTARETLNKSPSIVS